MLISTQQAAQIIGVGVSSIRRWAAIGKLPFVRVGSFRGFEKRMVGSLARRYIRVQGRRPAAKPGRKVDN